MSRAEHVSARASIVWHDLSGIRHVIATGEIDLTNAPELAAALDAPHLMVDLRRVTFLDSTGLAALVQARESAVSFELTASRIVRRLLEITGLLEVLDTAEDESDPLSAPN